MKRYTVPAAAMLLALVLSSCSEPAETTSSAAVEPQAISSAVEAQPESKPEPESEPESLPEESSSASEEAVTEQTESQTEEDVKEETESEPEEVEQAAGSNAPVTKQKKQPAPAPAPAAPAPAPAPAPAEQAPQNPEYVMPEEFDRLPTFEEMEPGQQGDNPMWGQPEDPNDLSVEDDRTIIFAQNGNQ